MPTQAQVQQTILSGQLKAANLTNVNLIALKGGILKVDWKPIQNITRFIKAVSRQYTLQDYTSINFLSVYDCLVNLIGLDLTVNTIDPNYQAPNTTIIVESGGASAVNYDYNESYLVDAGGGNWYLPYFKPNGDHFINGEIPVQVRVNGTSMTFIYDGTTGRIYGFANNDTQDILLTVVTTT